VDPTSSAARRRPFPFWVLQAAELAIALVLVDVGVHVERGGLLFAAAGILAVLALTARGPLSVVRLVGQRLHLVACIALAVLLALALLLPSLRPGAAGIVVVLVAGVGLVRLATLTRTDAGGLPAGSWPRPVIDARATVSQRTGAGSGAPAPSEAATAGPTSDGTANGSSGSPGSGAPPEGSTSDRLARLAGETVATGRTAARRHRPAVEAGARRGLRSLGRAVGRMGR
jgi:hypothetical protein